MIHNLVLIFVLVANLVHTNCHMFVNKMIETANKETKTCQKESGKLVIHVRTILHQEKEEPKFTISGDIKL